MVGELPDLWDFMVGEWDFDSITSRFSEEAVPGAVRHGPQGVHDQAGGRRRPVHVARHDGADGARRRARHDRRGPAVDRRPVPAQEDRGGSLGGHPRVHRLQHLRHRRLHRDPAALHPESDHGRGVAARLASRADPAEDHRRHAYWWWAPDRPASRPRRRSASAATTWCWPRPTSELGGRVAKEARLPGPVGVDPGARLPQGPAGAAAQRGARVRQRADRRRGARVRLRPRRDRDRRALAGRRRRAAGTCARSRSTRPCRC